MILKVNMKAYLGNFLLFVCNSIVNKIPSYTFRNWFYEKVMKFKIGENAAIHLGVKFLTRRNFNIGKNSVINQECLIDNRGGIEIGENVTLGHRVLLVSSDHDIHSDDFQGRNRPICVGNHVFIGAGAIVLGGVSMQDGSVLGAGSVLTKDTGANEVFIGVPAKYVIQRESTLNYEQDYKRTFF